MDKTTLPGSSCSCTSPSESRSGPPSSSNTDGNSITAHIKPGEHHRQCELCMTRARYRQGKEFKAVKVYTVNQESCHLILQNIPAIHLGSELKKLCSTFGRVECFDSVANYPPLEEFTETFYVKYASVNEARYAKKKLDNRSFYGGLIHIFYAPELETVEECREKLKRRKEYVERYVDPYTLSKRGKATTANVSDRQEPPPEIVGSIERGKIQEQRIFPRPSATEKEAKHLDSYLWKLEKRKKIREQSSCESSSYVCESEKAEIAPQEWARTGQKATFANQASISAPTTKTEFGKDIRIPNSTAGTSYSAHSSSTCATTEQLESRTHIKTSALSPTPTTSFSQPTSKDQVLFKPRQTYVKPKPLSETRIVFHLVKKKMEEDTTEDDRTTIKRNRDEDRDLKDKK